MNELKEKLLKRIEIDNNNCWIWQGCCGNGYGRIRHGAKMKLVHRASYEVFVGDIPEGLHIDHLCRVKLCCNPTHLEPVTNAENTRRGMQTKLTWKKVREIRKLYADGFSQTKLAEMFGVTQPLISDIILNKIWVEEVAA